MTAQIKTFLACSTSLLLVIAAWTLQYQMKPIAGVLKIGIVGTLLIFSAEFFYSWRKRKHFKIGSIRNWLRAHIVVGITGPLVILMHSYSHNRVRKMIFLYRKMIGVRGIWREDQSLKR